MVPPAFVAVEGSCLPWLLPASHGMREGSDVSSDSVELPMLSSVLLPTRLTLIIPLHCLPGTCAICEEVNFSLFPLLVLRLVLWRHPPKQWACKGVSVAISQLTQPHIHLHPSTALPSIFYSTTPLFLFCNAFPGGFNTSPCFICAYSSIFCIKTLLLKPQWFMWFWAMFLLALNSNFFFFYSLRMPSKIYQAM